MCACMNIYVPMNAQVCITVYMCACINIYKHAPVNIHMCMYCVHVHMYIHTCAHACVCTCMKVYAYTHGCIHVGVWICTHVCPGPSSSYRAIGTDCGTYSLTTLLCGLSEIFPHSLGHLDIWPSLSGIAWVD